jgi:Spy/CpxP family protein refolding chaperone
MAMGHTYRMNLLFDQLGVTDDQRVALKKLFKEHRQNIQPPMEIVMAKGRALRELVLAETPNQAAIRQASAAWATRLPKRRSRPLRWPKKPARS